MQIGSRIKQLRKQKKMSLTELAELTKVQIATLSRIENGIMTGTLACHMKIAQALGIELIDLYQGLQRDLEPASPDDKLEAIASADGKVVSEILATQLVNRKLLPSIIRMAPNSASPKESKAPGSEEFLYVLEGSIEVAMGSQKVRLNGGMSLILNAGREHFLQNTNDKPARILSVLTPSGY